LADRREDLDGFSIGPVVDDVHQKIGVGNRHTISKEIPTDHGQLLAFFR